MRGLAATFLVISLLFAEAGLSAADPIKRIQGTVKEVGEGFLLLVPNDHSAVRKFVLRWKARFVPPKLPLSGDHVLIFYKDKPEGSVIYGVNYLEDDGAPEPPDSNEGLEQESHN
jgi:hypothetical protein